MIFAVAADFHGKSDVFICGSFWEEFVVLENDSEFAAVFLEGEIVEACDVVAVYENSAFCKRDCAN